MTGRHVTTAVTMVVLCMIVVVAAVVGFNTLFAPLPGDDEPAAAPSPTCAVPPAKEGRRLRSGQVVVNVFNAGTRGGLAGTTLDALRERGFRGGTIGNAPEGTKLRRVQVWVTEGEEDAGRLVARQFGRRTPVVTPDTDLVAGVDVVVGNKFRSLAPAPRSVKVRQEAEGTC
ncbi:MAG TPA: LytR C-terminal domain-containing protein [Nocardioides sp.]|nr:LytR C-terminal domain-containing protein [Nocardioides sp.]